MSGNAQVQGQVPVQAQQTKSKAVVIEMEQTRVCKTCVMYESGNPIARNLYLGNDFIRAMGTPGGMPMKIRITIEEVPD